MAEPTIQLDRTKPYGECHGERLPDDPHYSVHFWQGGKMRGHHVLLPFDVNGKLIPDDGSEDKKGLGILSNGETGPMTYKPLWTPLMREYRDAKLKRMAAIAQAGVPELVEDGEEKEADDLGGAPEDEVNFAAYLRGEVRYAPHLLFAAAKKTYHKSYTSIKELVTELVLDEKVIPEAQLSEALVKYLPDKVAA